MEPQSQISSSSLRAELERLIGQATELAGMNQLSRTFLELLHAESDPENKCVIKEAILALAQKAVDAKKAMELRESQTEAPDVSCQVIFCVRDVKCYRISQGTSELLVQADMHIALVSTEHGHEMAFVEIGSFHYPLTPAIPCLRTCVGSYILALQDDVYYGLTLPDGIPEPYIQALDRVLTALADFRIESHEPVPAVTPAAPPPEPMAERVASTLEAGAERLSQGIENTTALLAAGIEASQGFLQARIQPLEEPMSVNPFISLALRGAASGSGYIVAVKPVVIEKFVSIARFVGRHTAAWVLPTSTNTPAEGATAESNGSDTKATLKRLGGAAFVSASRVWDSLSKAGDTLMLTTGKSASALVKHRYGAEAGAAAENAVNAVRNSVNIYNIKASSFIKSAAIASGKATVKDYVAAQKAADKGEPSPDT